MKCFIVITTMVLASLTLHPTCFGMDADFIREIAKKPHNRDNLLDELKIYPDAREYEVVVRSGKPSDKLVAAPSVMVAEKIVEGKYVVSECQPPGANAPFFLVVTFDSNEQVYRKWALLADGTLAESIGTAVPNTRMLSWVSRSPEKDARDQVLASEIHTDEGTRWREVMLEAGKVVRVIEGTARKTK